MKKCIKCGYIAENEEMSFCVRCGNKLEEYNEPEPENVCPKCGKINHDDNAFCMYCGSKLESVGDNASDKTEPDINSSVQHEQSIHSSRKAVKTAAILFSAVVAASAATVGAVYAVKNDLFSKPAAVQNIQTVDKRYNIKGKYYADIDGIVYFANEEGKLCSVESEAGIRTISGKKVLEVIANNGYIYYTTEDGLYAYNTADGKITNDLTDGLVSIAVKENIYGNLQMMTIDKNGNVFSFKDALADLKSYCVKFTQADNSPRLFSGKNIYAYYNNYIYMAKVSIQKIVRSFDTEIKELCVSDDGSKIYFLLNDGWWISDSDMKNEQKIIDSTDISDVCCDDGYIVFDQGGICVIDTRTDAFWRLSDKPVDGIGISENIIYFTSADDGYIYSVPVEGGDVTPLTYYMEEIVNQ